MNKTCKKKEPEYKGETNKKGETVRTETYDKGIYTETITRVDHKDGTYDIYVDKTSK